MWRVAHTRTMVGRVHIPGIPTPGARCSIGGATLAQRPVGLLGGCSACAHRGCTVGRVLQRTHSVACRHNVAYMWP